MQNTEHNNTSETISQPLNLFPAGLSLVCPGLGQLVQGRRICLVHFFLWALVLADACGALLFIRSFDDIMLLPFGRLLLLAVPFMLFSAWDAATWKRRKTSKLKNCLFASICLFVFLGTIVLFVIPPMQNALRLIDCRENMRLIGNVLQVYQDKHGALPPAYTVDENGNPLHSWRVLILPYMGYRELYEQIRLDEPWDSEHNRQFHEVRIPDYQCPASSRNARRLSTIRNVFFKNRDILRVANCDYSVVIGKNTAFPGSGKAVSRDDIADRNNTILVVERMVPVNWMDPTNEIRFEVAIKGINKHPLGIGSEHTVGAVTNLASGANFNLRHTADGHIDWFSGDIESIEPFLTITAEDE